MRWRSLDSSLGQRACVALSLTSSHRNPAYAGDGAESRAVSPFCCPITGAEFTSKNRFVVVRKTGHVVAEKAFKVKLTGSDGTHVPGFVATHLQSSWANSGHPHMRRS